MSPLIIALLIGAAFVAVAVRAAIGAGRLSVAVRILAALTFAVVAFVSAWGFAAAMEPGADHIIWRVLYGSVFAACLSAVVRLVVAKRKPSETASNHE